MRPGDYAPETLLNGQTLASGTRLDASFLTFGRRRQMRRVLKQAR